MEGDDRYPQGLREHGEAALALSSFKIKESRIQNLPQPEANPNGGNDVVIPEEIGPNAGNDVVIPEEINPNAGNDVIPEEMVMVNPNGVNDIVPLAQPEEMIMANPDGGNDVVPVAQPEGMIMANPNGGNDDVVPMMMANPNGGNDVVLVAQPEGMIMANPNGGNDDVVPMMMANPNGGNEVVPGEMIMANPDGGGNDDVDPDATESSSEDPFNPPGVVLSFASYTSSEEPASSSEIPLSEITVNFSEGHSVCSTSKEPYKGSHVKPVRPLEEVLGIEYPDDFSPQVSTGQSWVEEEPPKGGDGQ